MITRLATIMATFALAFVILVVSVLRSATVVYVFSQSPSPSPTPQEVEIDYQFAYPGRILPDHPLWSIKVIRDKFWLMVTTDPLKKAEILLLLADKRLVSAENLFEKDKAELGVTVLTKAEKYFERAVDQERVARDKGIDTNQLLIRLSKASLKHREVLEQILANAPEDAKPIIVETINYPKGFFDQIKISLGEAGLEVLDNPFEQ